VIVLLKNNLNLFLFQNQNNFLNNLFNLFYRLLKCKKKNLNDFLYNYIKLGYSKSKKISLSEVQDIKNNIYNSKKIIKKNLIEYEIDKTLQIKLKNIFLKNFSEEIEYFSDYFNSKIFVTHAKIFTNLGYSKNSKKKEQYFSENYHTDNYIFTYFKLFINLENVDLEMGPLHFVPKNKQKEFIKITKYKNRFSYNDSNIDNLVFKNTGDIGESIFVNTTQNFHRAGIPKNGKSRTVILFHLNAIPNNKDTDNFFYFNSLKEDIFADDKISRLVSKPHGIYQTLKLFRSFVAN